MKKFNDLLSTITESLDGLKNEYENDIQNYKDRISELEKDIIEMPEPDSEIDCGIGIIEYIEPDNILLQSLMENLEELIKSYSALEVNRLLESKLKEKV